MNPQKKPLVKKRKQIDISVTIVTMMNLKSVKNRYLIYDVMIIIITLLLLAISGLLIRVTYLSCKPKPPTTKLIDIMNRQDYHFDRFLRRLRIENAITNNKIDEIHQELASNTEINYQKIAEVEKLVGGIVQKLENKEKGWISKILKIN